MFFCVASLAKSLTLGRRVFLQGQAGMVNPVMDLQNHPVLFASIAPLASSLIMSDDLFSKFSPLRPVVKSFHGNAALELLLGSVSHVESRTMMHVDRLLNADQLQFYFLQLIAGLLAE